MRKPCCVLCAVTLVVAAVTPKLSFAAFNPADFNGLDADQRQVVVFAGLRAREARLTNFEWSVTANGGAVDPATQKESFIYREQLTFRRVGNKLWIHVLAFDGRAETPRVDMIANWDGARAKSVTRNRGFTKVSGRIRNAENANFKTCAYNQVLGVRVLDNGPPCSLVDWLDWSIHKAKHTAVSMTAESLSGSPVIKVQAKYGAAAKTFWFDPDRDFVCVRTEYLYQVNASYNKESTVVTDFRKIDGLDIPAVAVRRTGTSAASAEGAYRYELTSAKMGGLSDSDIAVVFPVGSEIVDTINTVAYDVLENGKYKLLPIADPPHGILRRAPVHDVRDVVGAEASQLYANEDLGKPARAIGVTPQGRTIRLVAGGTMIVMAAVALWTYRRGRRRRATSSGHSPDAL